ncbi:MAG: hypothetical protein AAFV93_11490 [Chloroflexota bacterium]
MLRLAKTILFLGFIALFFGVVAIGFLLILSGGDPVDFARTAYLNYTLSGRLEELNTPAGTDPTELLCNASRR